MTTFCFGVYIVDYSMMRTGTVSGTKHEERSTCRQCSGSMTFRCGSGSADPCLWLIDPDPDADPNPVLFVIDLQDAIKKLI